MAYRYGETQIVMEARVIQAMIWYFMAPSVCPCPGGHAP